MFRKVSAISKQWHCLQQASLQEAKFSETTCQNAQPPLLQWLEPRSLSASVFPNSMKKGLQWKASATLETTWMMNQKYKYKQKKRPKWLQKKSWNSYLIKCIKCHFFSLLIFRHNLLWVTNSNLTPQSSVFHFNFNFSIKLIVTLNKWMGKISKQ